MQKYLNLELVSPQFLVTTILIISVIITERIAVASVKRSSMAAEPKRRWLVFVRNAGVVAVLLGLIFVWGSELKSLALSVVAILAAIVLATKELIACFTGALMKAGSNSFKIGDKIEVSNLRGEVIDHNFLTTTLLEIGPGQSIHHRTGRRIVFPNSLILANAVFSESFAHNFVLHVFSVRIEKGEDWRLAESILLDASNKACKDFLDDAISHFERLGRQEGLDSSNAAPKVILQVTDKDELTLVVRFAVPVGRRSQIEQEVLRAFADEFYKAPKAAV